MDREKKEGRKEKKEKGRKQKDSIR